MTKYAMSQLPERFRQKPQSKELTIYITEKYSQYGYRRVRSIEYNPESKDNRYRWVENVTRGLRKVGDSDDIISLNHTGWYTDNYHDETVHGEVYQLPARHGSPQYVPAVNDPDNRDCACVDFRSVTDDKEQCARDADRMAETWAEESREYQAKEDAENRIAEITQEMKDVYAEFRRISRGIRANCEQVQGVQVVKDLVREKWQNTKRTIHKLRTERSKIQRDGMEY